MHAFLLFCFATLFFAPVFCQTVPVQGYKNPPLGSPSLSTENLNLKNIFMGQQPFSPFLVRKLAIGHPEGVIGVGATQQYSPHPYPFSWQNDQLMQPVKGLPKYPLFVLNDISPTMSHFNNPKNMQSFSAGLLDGNGINTQFRQVKIVEGFPLR